MNCQDRTDFIHLYAAGALPDAEAMELREHLATGCPACQTELAGASAVASMLPLSLDPVNPPANLKDRLMRRIDAEIERERQPVAPTNLAEPWGMRIFRILAPAAVAAGVTLICTHYYMNRLVVDARNQASLYQHRETSALLVAATLNERLQTAQDQLRKQTQQVEYLTTQASADKDQISAARLQLAALKKQVDDQSAIVAMLESDKVRLVVLKPTDLQKGAVAHLVWDEAHRKWAVLVAGMKQETAGETYELWFVTTAGAKIRAGTFDVDKAGAAAVMIDLPADLGPLKLVAVTNEKAGGVAVPAGQFQMLGDL